MQSKHPFVVLALNLSSSAQTGTFPLLNLSNLSSVCPTKIRRASTWGDAYNDVRSRAKRRTLSEATLFARLILTRPPLPTPRLHRRPFVGHFGGSLLVRLRVRLRTRWLGCPLGGCVRLSFCRALWLLYREYTRPCPAKRAAKGTDGTSAKWVAKAQGHLCSRLYAVHVVPWSPMGGRLGPLREDRDYKQKGTSAKAKGKRSYMLREKKEPKLRKLDGRRIQRPSFYSTTYNRCACV